MPNNENEKNNSLCILSTLLDGKISKEDLIEKFEIKDSTFFKHLQFIRENGFNIVRCNDSYELLYSKNYIEFAQYEISLFAYIFLLAYVLLPKNKVINFKKALEKSILLSNEKTYNLVKEKYEYYRRSSVYGHYRDKIIILKKYIDNKNLVIFYIKNGKKVKAYLKEFSWGNNDKIYLTYLTLENEEKKICLENIVKILEEDKNYNLTDVKETIFELSGKLSKSYLLRDDERIIDSTKDKIVVASSNSDKDALFKRLLRYDILCKVILPKEDVEKMKNIIQKSLDNIS